MMQPQIVVPSRPQVVYIVNQPRVANIVPICLPVQQPLSIQKINISRETPVAQVVKTKILFNAATEQKCQKEAQSQQNLTLSLKDSTYECSKTEIKCTPIMSE